MPQSTAVLVGISGVKLAVVFFFFFLGLLPTFELISQGLFFCWHVTTPLNLKTWEIPHLGYFLPKDKRTHAQNKNKNVI